MTETNRPLRVLFLTACTGRGGAGKSLYYLCKYLDRSRVEPLVVMPESGKIGGKLDALGIPTVIASRLRERTFELRFARANPATKLLSFLMNLWDSALFPLELSRIARRRDADVIYCNHMMVKIMGIVTGLLTRTPVVLHTRTIYGNPLERYLYLSFAALPHVRRIVAVSDAAAANFREISEKVRVIRNGIPVEEIGFREKGGRLEKAVSFPPGTALVGFVGRLVDWKGIDVFLEAAERLLESRDDVAFVVLGDVPVGSTHATLDDYRRYVRERGMAERVELLGFKENATEYVRDFRVLVVPSVRPDPCPRTVLEGMAVGTPIIGSASGGIREVLHHDVTGLLVRPGRADDIVEQVERILDDPELAEDIAARARQAVEEDFNAEGVSRRIQTILEEVG